MNPSISKILNAHRADGVIHTHVSMIQPKGKFLFSRQNLEDFWELYNNSVIEEEDVILGVAEKPQDYLPVLVDIDIKVKVDDDTNMDGLYKDYHINKVINIYQSVLRNIVEDCSEENLLCVVLEKDLYTIEKNEIMYAKNGFHLHFPNCFLSKEDQKVHLIPRVQDLLNETKIFEDIGFSNSGDLVDTSYCNVPWLLYGSRKNENMKPYIITKIYNSSADNLNIEEAFKYYQIFDIKNRLINIRDNVLKYIPRILSILPYGRNVNEIKRGLISPLKNKILKEKKQNIKKYKKLSVERELEMAKKLLPMISIYRSEDYTEWMTVGWALYNISEGSTDGLELWLEFSSRSEDNYDETRCVYEWDRMVKKDITIGTLKYYASIDNPDQFREFRNKNKENLVRDSLKNGGSHNDIAKILYNEYAHDFVCSSITNKTWYQYINHKWEQIEDGVFLREKISTEIWDSYKEEAKKISEAHINADGKGEEAMYEANLKNVKMMMRNVKSAPYKNNVMREACEVFYNKKFREKLDADPYLIGFKNGVYDLKSNIFRNGKPEDYISKSLAIDYREYNEDDEEVHEVHSFLEKVFPDKSVRNYFMDNSSDIFVGGNHQKVVIFWLGEGDNGKSVTQSIFEKMLGQLAIKFNTTLITGKKTTTGTANPELARAGNGVRWAVLEEPDGDEQINIGTLKNLSGNDSYWARDLFEKGKDTREFTPMFKLIFICNKLPKLKFSDKATWNRIRVLPFESTFCRPEDPAPETYEEQLRQKRFPMDKEFSKKIPNMIQAFAWVLLEHRKKVTIRIEPEKVRAATAIYRKQNDVYRQFIEERIISDKKSQITLSDLNTDFKEWFREANSGQSLPSKMDIKEYFEKVWGDIKRGRKWTGYRLRNYEDDIKDGEIVILEESEKANYNQEETKISSSSNPLL